MGILRYTLNYLRHFQIYILCVCKSDSKHINKSQGAYLLLASSPAQVLGPQVRLELPKTEVAATETEAKAAAEAPAKAKGQHKYQGCDGSVLL
jgi:hypothetical protein